MDNVSAIRNSQEEVAERILALLGVVGLAHQREQATPWIVKNRIGKYFSENGMALYSDLGTGSHLIVQFSWRAEAIVPMILSLNGHEEMPTLTDQFNIFDGGD